MSSAAQQFVDEQIAAHKVMMFSKTYCPFCTKAKKALTSAGVTFEVIELEHRKDMDAIQDVLKRMTGARSVPRVFINGKCIGGGDETAALQKKGKLAALCAA